MYLKKVQVKRIKSVFGQASIDINRYDLSLNAGLAYDFSEKYMSSPLRELCMKIIY